MKKYFTFTIFFICITVFAGNLEFAEFLFKEGDYFRCITELKRELYENQSADTLKTVNLIVASYIKMNDYKNASEEAFDCTARSTDIEYNYLLSLFLEKKYETIDTFTVISGSESKVFKDLSLIFQKKFSKADTMSLCGESKEIYNGYSMIKNKNPYIAVLLSALLPGLGRVYSDRSGDGIFSFLTVLTPALIAAYYYAMTDNDVAFYVSAAAAGVFYIGELYGAFNSANTYHRDKAEAYYKKVILDYSNTLFSPKFSF